MNKIKSLLLLGLGGLALIGCDKPEIGYMITENAAYPVDSMEILTLPALEAQITELQQKKDNFLSSETALALTQRKTELEAEVEKANQRIDNIRYNELYPLDDQLETATGEQYDQLMEQRAIIRAKIRDIEDQRYQFLQEIKAVEKEMGEEILAIEATLLASQRRLKDTIPWSTSVIDGVLGTQPIVYSIAGIRSEGSGDAVAFSRYLSIMGVGRLVVDWDENLPAGCYLVSIQISNEGHTRILEDVFTFIVI